MERTYDQRLSPEGVTSSWPRATVPTRSGRSRLQQVLGGALLGLTVAAAANQGVAQVPNTAPAEAAPAEAAPAEAAPAEAVVPVEAKSDKPAPRRLWDVAYVERDGQPLKADLYVPGGDGPHPGVLMIHGGAWVVGSKLGMRPHAEALLARGYAVLSVNYRLAPTAKYPAQLDDCRDALRWLRAHAAEHQIDPSRLAVYGYSAGGHLAVLLAAADPPHGERVAAVVAGGAPCDLCSFPEDSKFLAYFLGGSRAQFPDRYRDASPINWVSADDPPMLFFHGGRDLMVPKVDVERMCGKLREAGVAAELLEVDGQGHIATYLSSSPRRAAADFLDRVLRAAGPAEPSTP